MSKMFFVALLTLAALSAQAESTKYEGACVKGVVSAKKVGAKGPAKTLTLMIAGEKSIECTKGDKIELSVTSEVSETPQEGLKFSAMVTITPKAAGAAKVIIVSTFQEKAFPRSTPGKSI